MNEDRREDRLDFSRPVEPSSSCDDTASSLAVDGRILWDSGPEAQAHLAAQGETLRALLQVLARRREDDPDRE